MNPLEIGLRIFNGRYITKGMEIIPLHCPFCKGGQNKDKYTFALNVNTGLYNCKRGSCGAQGNLRQLCEKFNIPFDSKPSYEITAAPKKKQYKKPVTKMENPGTEIEKYLKVRGFSKETLQKNKIGESKNRIVFPYYENKELVAVKFRAKDDNGKWKKFSMEPGGKLVLWGMDDCDPIMPLIICEGEMDKMALDEAGIPNAVSLPNGVNSLDCLDLCWEWLQRFNRYYIWTDNDAPGIECRDNLIKRLGIGKCYVVSSNRKDANEVLYYEGKDGIAKCLSEAKAIPLAGLKDLSELPEYEPEDDVVVKTGFIDLDKVFDGGFRMGEVSVWTGTNSSGKSTILGQIMLQAIDQGFKVCAYSGELPDRIFRYWIDLQAAGSEYIKNITRNGRNINQVSPDVIQHIRMWYKGKFFLYDAKDFVTQDKILDVFEYAYQRYGCCVFMVDNLMSLALDTDNEKDFYRKQAKFIGKCKAFTEKYNVHIHVVAHPRKTQTGEVTKQDIAGSADIANWADNVIRIKRYTQKELSKLQDKEEFRLLNISSSLEIQKNRFRGKQDIEVLLGFDENSKRLYPAKSGNFNWQYGWIAGIGQKPTIEQFAEWEAYGTAIDCE